jgi:hypothetical protein
MTQSKICELELADDMYKEVILLATNVDIKLNVILVRAEVAQSV